MEALRQPELPVEEWEEDMKCLLCQRRAEDGLCQYHREAKQRVESAYPRWMEAYGSLTWADYLDRIKHNPETGQWAKEAAGILGERNDKASS